MEKLTSIVLFITIIGILCTSGCSTTAPQIPASGNQGTRQAITIATTAPASIVATTTSAGRVIIDEKINLQSGYQTMYQKYSFEDYGYQYLYPNDVFRISINSDKQVNVLVIDKDDELKFPIVEPGWNIGYAKDQWDYSPVVPVLSQSNVLRKDMTIAIKEKGSYFIIIDPRFASDNAGWKSGKHEAVNVDVKVTKF
jgi:hypothetical protein